MNPWRDRNIAPAQKLKPSGLDAADISSDAAADFYQLTRAPSGALFSCEPMEDAKVLEAVIAAAVTGILSLVGTIITVWGANQKTNETLKITQAVTDTKIDELTREVREHNNFARRMPVVEEQIKVINHRIEDLENDGK